MARQKSTIPTLRFHRSSGRYYLWLDGRRRYLGTDRAAAEVLRARLVAAQADGNPHPPPVRTDPGLTVAEAFLEFERRELPRKNDPRTIARYRAAIDAALAVHARLPAAQFRSLALIEVRDHLLALKVKRKRKARGPRKGPRGKVLAPAPPPPPPPAPLSRSYVNHLVGCLQAAWAWLVSREVVPAETLAYVQAVRALREGEDGRETPRVAPPEPDAVEATLPHMGPVIRAMSLLQLLTGARPGEICGMRRCDLSTSPAEKLALPNTKLSIAAFVDEESDELIWLFVPPRHKTSKKGKPRAVAIGPKARDVLRPFLDGRPADAPLFSPRLAVEGYRKSLGRSTATGRAPGERYNTQSYGKAVAKAVERGNRIRAAAVPPLPPIPHWSPNQLRHRNATETSEEFDRETAAARLGHAGMDVIDIYAMQALRKAARAAAKMG